MPNQCFHDGDFWYAVAPTAAGQSPTTHPEFWRRILIPAAWRRLLVKLMEARIQRAEGQQDKAIAAEREVVKLWDRVRANGQHGRERVVQRQVRTR